MSELVKYWNKSIDYQAYKNKVQEGIEKQETFWEYAKLNLQRMQRLDKSFQFSPTQKQEMDVILIEPKLLVISEGWCGDAAQILPIINQIALYKKWEMRIVFRDENADLMNNYLTDGSNSIPIIIGLDEKAINEWFHWGPRPQEGMTLLYKHKSNPEVYSKDSFYTDLQKYYNKNKGKDIFNEFIEIVKK